MRQCLSRRSLLVHAFPALITQCIIPVVLSADEEKHRDLDLSKASVSAAFTQLRPPAAARHDGVYQITTRPLPCFLSTPLGTHRLLLMARAFTLLTFLSGLGQALAAQVPLQSHKELPDNSNFILASLHSLLKSWDTAYAPNGHAVMPATVKPGTLLYHMGGSPAPTGLDWFA